MRLSIERSSPQRRRDAEKKREKRRRRPGECRGQPAVGARRKQRAQRAGRRAQAARNGGGEKDSPWRRREEEGKAPAPAPAWGMSRPARGWRAEEAESTEGGTPGAGGAHGRGEKDSPWRRGDASETQRRLPVDILVSLVSPPRLRGSPVNPLFRSRTLHPPRLRKPGCIPHTSMRYSESLRTKPICQRRKSAHWGAIPRPDFSPTRISRSW